MSRSKLFGLMAMSVLFEGNGERWHDPNIRANTNPPINTPIPKGCKEYFFYEDGDFVSGEKPLLPDVCLFTCIASNDKNAIRKFNKWKEEKK